MEPYRPFVDQIVLGIIDRGENFLEMSSNIKSQLLDIATVDVKFERGRSPLMVGIQYTTASLAKCYDGSFRKIQYPLIKDFNLSKASSRTQEYAAEEGSTPISQTPKSSKEEKNDLPLPF